MEKTSNSSRTGSEITFNKGNSYTARLRRLKIQEGILSVNVNKTYLELQGVSDGSSKDADLKIYKKNLKDSYIELKNLYEDIKIKTELTDVKDIKRDILQFEEKLKSFKQFLKAELNSKQGEEITLTSKEYQPTQNINHHTPYVLSSKIQTKRFNEIVPSPVRVLINSPFKCAEIHQFQEFMKNSPNRYGGWNEYNHNLFIQIWNKYNGNEIFASGPVEDLIIFRDFKDEVLHKISGIQHKDVILHSEWYAQYIDLKMSQQKALDNWKENKKKIKNARRESKITQTNGSNIDKVFANKLCKKSVSNEKYAVARKNFKIFDDGLSGNVTTKTDNECLVKVNLSRLMRPTKQWLNKCESEKEVSLTTDFNVENISKLRVPTWRLNTKSS